ncbi:hypothetical protein FSARC_7629 [Fusarium sarcochroum]|uniref:Zn(2)-C6 fungal-type domain-containing protein n=1 Tax=Fusarium sarcochroum TaxID=1208366 RepID=A0A8H4X763_9HYPO|nr:hypothetical protein FSARC_7629 [Fusarium sarcochroum]
MPNESAHEKPNTAANAAATNAPQTSNAGRKRRSCLMCSKRKVKCDKQKPCNSCVKAGNECVFPDVSANRSQVGMSPELVEMLQRLEKAIHTLEPGSLDRPEGILPHEQLTVGDNRDILPALEHDSRQDDATIAMGDEPSNQNDKGPGAELDSQQPGSSKLDGASSIAPSVPSCHGDSPGKIIRDHGRDTYVKRWFWHDRSTETSSGSSSEFDYDDVPPEEDPMVIDGNLHSNLHPLQSKESFLQTLVAQRMRLWSIYKERVEPLTKLLHLPSLEPTVLETQLLSSVDGMQCIILAVYYGGITSLSEEECVLMFQNSQAQVLSRIRAELEKMFASVDLIHTGDIRPLQALVLYLVFLRHHEPRLSWKLSGLAVRLAQNFGIHREDSFSGLSKFEADMRRRLWWQLAITEAPSAEDYSGEYNLLEISSFDTQPPRNLDDAQLYLGMTEYPPEVRGLTEMTFILARCEITTMYRCIADSRRLCGKTGKGYVELTLQERADWVDACETGFSDRFLRDRRPSNAFEWITIILTRMLFHKVRLHGCKPLHSASMTEDSRDRLFLVAVEVIELNYKLRTDPRSRPYLWLFGSYTPWHAFSLVLVWLQVNPICRGSRRAWEAVEKAITLRWEHPPSLLNGRKPQQWRLIIRLLDKARSARREVLSKRGRRGSRHVNDSYRGSLKGPEGPWSVAVAAAQSSTTTNSAKKPPQLEPYPQTQQQQPHTIEGSAPGPLAFPTPQAVTTDISSSETQQSNTVENTWGLAYENPLPDFSEDVQMPNFYLFDNTFQGVFDMN